MILTEHLLKIRDFVFTGADYLEEQGDKSCEVLRDALTLPDVTDDEETLRLVTEELETLDEDFNLFATGSRVICPKHCHPDTDYDYVCYHGSSTISQRVFEP